MRTLMLDVDGVLVCGRPSDGRPVFSDLEEDLGLSPDRLHKAFFAPYWRDIVTGKDDLMGRLSAVLRDLAPSIGAQQLVDYWFEHDSRIDDSVLDAVEALRNDGTRVFLATNQEHHRARYLAETMKLGDHVDGIIYSARLGHRKPSVEFFELAAAEAGVSAEKVVFVDDTLQNVEAAAAFGWHAVHWRAGMDLLDIVNAR